MENAGMEFIATTAQLMNTIAFTTRSKRPNSDRVLTNRRQELTRRIPAHGMDWFSVSLHYKPHDPKNRVNHDTPKEKAIQREQKLYTQSNTDTESCKDVRRSEKSQ